MKISGLLKVSLLNYPGLVCATIFLSDCNFRCPFCHNSSIAKDEYENLSEDDVLNYLEERKKMLDGVCISGGEPTIHKDLEEFITKIRCLGLKVKLDTNGYAPQVLKNLLDKNLLDYIAMDIKNSKEKYSEITGTIVNIGHIEDSIDLIMNSGIDYEFRTTLVSEYHTLSDIEKIAKRIKGAEAYYLQNFEDSGNIMQSGLHGFKKEEMLKFQDVAKKYVQNTNVRGVD